MHIFTVIHAAVMFPCAVIDHNNPCILILTSLPFAEEDRYWKHVRLQDGIPERVACRDLTMGVREGECFGLLGPNGAGKMLACSRGPSGAPNSAAGLD